MARIRTATLSLLVVLAVPPPRAVTDRPAAGQPAGVVEGRVIVKAPPPPATLQVTTDHKVCGQAVPDESIVAGPGGGVAHAVVVVGGTRAPAGGAPVVTNKGCQFVPHVQVVRPGGAITIASEDPTLHTTHAYAEDGRSLYNVAIPMPGLKVTRPIVRGVTRLGCDAHPWMRGFLVATEELASATDAAGGFRIDGVPPGTYELRVWHERLAAPPRTITVAAGATTTAGFELGAKP